jgi:hypothetical protein
MSIRAIDELADAIEIIDEAILSVREGPGIEAKAELARSLTAKAMLLNAIGRREEALTCISEAVHMSRQLAQSNPAYRPMLARSLLVQAVAIAQVRARLTEANRRESSTSDSESSPQSWSGLEPPLPEDRDPEIDLIERVVDTIGFPRVIEWLQAPVPSLRGRTPYSLMASEEGRKEVETVLGQIEHGIF